jgi:hypothetical protein
MLLAANTMTDRPAAERRISIMPMKSYQRAVA